MMDRELPDVGIMLSNFFGLNTGAREGYINVAHGWVVFYYIVLMLSAPLIVRAASAIKKGYWDWTLYAAFVLVMPLLPVRFLTHMWPLTATFAGMLACKYNLFAKCKSCLRSRGIIMRLSGAALILVVTMALRHFFSGYNAWGRLDGLYAFSAILSFLLVYSVIGERVKSVFYRLGAMSLFLWFAHSIFVFDPTLNSLLYAARYPLLITLWGAILMTPPALFVDAVHRIVLKPFNRKTAIA